MDTAAKSHCLPLRLRFATIAIGTALTPFSMPFLLLGQQPLLQITSPANGSIVTPGQTLLVSVSSPAGASFAQVDVIGESPIGISNIATSVPSQLSLTIPADIALGTYQLTAEGTTTSGQDAQSVPIAVDVERSDLPNLLSIKPSGTNFQRPTQTIPIIALATFSDGSVLDVTRSSYLGFVSTNTTVATVDAKGLVTALSAGDASITVTYKVGSDTLQTSVPVNVAPSGAVPSGSNFLLSATPPNQTIVPGSSATFIVFANSFNGFAQAVQLSAGGLPSGVTAGFSPTSVSVPGSSTLVISTLGSTPLGNYLVTITGTSGTLNPSVGISLGLSTTAPPPPPSISSLSPQSGTVGTSVTVTGVNFGATQGTSIVTFNGTAATPTSWSATSIVVPVPNGATTGNVVVTVGGVASNGVSFTVASAAPHITTLNPHQAAVGGSVTITGSNFGSTQGASSVTFGGKPGSVSSWSATSIVVTVGGEVPEIDATVQVVVGVGGVASNAWSFTICGMNSICPPGGGS